MEELFVSRSTKATPGLNLGVILGLPKNKLQQGEVGIEIEVEGKNLPSVSQAHPPPPWVYKPDHSLRGDENGEYVLKAPIPFSEVPQALSKLWDCFEKAKTKFDDSNRTSVHIHLNVQSWHINRLTAFCALHFILEEVLVEWCGEHRVGNLFCLRAKDAEAIITWLKKFVQRDGEFALPDGLHYAGLNAQALQKFGSLEVRSLRGVSDPNIIQDWVKIYERLYRLSADFKDPTEICDWFSAEGPTAFFDRILGEVGSVVRSGIELTSDQIQDSMYAGVRRAQDICFCRDWKDFKALDVSDNPFGFTKKKLIQKAMQASGLAVADEAGDDEGIYLQPEYENVTEDELEDALEQLDTPPQYASPPQGIQWNSSSEIFASFSSNPFGS
jgi:hypothetical protein